MTVDQREEIITLTHTQLIGLDRMFFPQHQEHTVAHKRHDESQSHNESQSHAGDESESHDKSQSHDENQSNDESQKPRRKLKPRQNSKRSQICEPQANVERQMKTNVRCS